MFVVTSRRQPKRQPIEASASVNTLAVVMETCPPFNAAHPYSSSSCSYYYYLKQPGGTAGLQHLNISSLHLPRNKDDQEQVCICSSDIRLKSAEPLLSMASSSSYKDIVERKIELPDLNEEFVLDMDAEENIRIELPDLNVSFDAEHQHVDQRPTPIYDINSTWFEHFWGSQAENLKVGKRHCGQSGCSNSSTQHCPTPRIDVYSMWFRHFSGIRAESLDVEQCRGDETPSPYLISGLVKRLKLSNTADDRPGTKNFEIGESSSLPKGDEQYNRTSDHEGTSSQSASRALIAGQVEPMGSNKSLVRPASAEAVKRRPWTERWLDNPRPGHVEEVYVPKNLMAWEEYGQQCPSFEARAMMGRVLKNLKPLKVEDRGTYKVWFD